MTLARALVLVSIVAFAMTGIGYLVAPGAMLSVVGIGGTPTETFLIRTEGVALIAAAGLL